MHDVEFRAVGKAEEWKRKFQKETKVGGYSVNRQCVFRAIVLTLACDARVVVRSGEPRTGSKTTSRSTKTE